MTRLVRSVSHPLGLGLVFLGGARLNHVPLAVRPLEAIGIPAELLALVGVGEIAIGLLLTQAALHRFGGVILAAWMLGAGSMHLLATDTRGAVLPFVLAAFGLVLARQGRAGHRSPAWPATLRPPRASGIGNAWFVGRHVGVSFLIRWAVGGVAFWCALPFLALSHAKGVGATSHRERLEHVLLYLLFYGYGVGGIWNFTGHFFAGDMVAASVGWPVGSPFQQELAFYALGTGTVGLLTPWLRDRFWIAAAVVPSVFAYGAAYTHVEDFLITGNDAPMNWSFSAVGANLLIPTAVLALTWTFARVGGFRHQGESLRPSMPHGREA